MALRKKDFFSKKRTSTKEDVSLCMQITVLYLDRKVDLRDNIIEHYIKVMQQISFEQSILVLKQFSLFTV